MKYERLVLEQGPLTPKLHGSCAAVTIGEGRGEKDTKVKEEGEIGKTKDNGEQMQL